MRKAALPYILSLSLSTLPLSAAAPELAWSSFLGGGGDDVTEDVLIEGNTVYVVGTTESEDFPGAVYPPGLRHPFVAAIGLDGTFRFASILDIGLFAEGRSVAAGPQALYLGGQANLGFGSDEAGGFVARLGRANGELLDWQLLGNAAVNDLEVIDDGEIWATTGGRYWGDWAVWKLDLSSPPVSVLFSQEDDIQALELGPANDLYLTGGDVDSRFFFQGSYVERRTRSGDVVFRTLLPGSGPVYFSEDLAVTPDGKVYVVGLINQASGDDLFVAKLDASGQVERVRVLGGSAEDTARAVALGPSGEVFVAGTTRSEDFPVRDPIVPECDTPGGACAFVIRLDSNLDLVWSTYLAASTGGSWGRSIGIDAGADGPVVVGHTDGSLFPLVMPFDAEAAAGEGFVARIRDGNQPPDCSAATASPSVIWPPNGKMVPVSIQGLGELAVEITGIAQDEPGAAFSGIGSSVARVKAERDGKGDGRVYSIEFEATDPAGASCSGEVFVCVPHDRSQQGCSGKEPVR